MAHRDVHYDAAFGDYLRCRGLPYVAVDEAKRAIFGRVSLKSFDFVVYSTIGANLLVDVKGRKFPDSAVRPKRGAVRLWENWITRGDVEGLREWEKIFGPDFAAVVVFAYWLQGPPQNSPFSDVHIFRKKHYAFVAVRLDEYVAAARPRSQKWQTLSVPSKEFSRQAQDVATFL